MKWFIILIMIILPVIASADDDGAPVADPAASSGPEVETQGDPHAQEQVRDGDSAGSVDVAAKVPASRGDKDDKTGVRFQSIEDLNKLGR